MGFCKIWGFHFGFCCTNSWPPRLSQVGSPETIWSQRAGWEFSDRNRWEKNWLFIKFFVPILEGRIWFGWKKMYFIYIYNIFHFFHGSGKITILFRGGFTDDWNPKAETLAIGALLVDSKKSRTSITQLAVNKILIWWKNVSRSSGASGDQKCIKHGTFLDVEMIRFNLTFPNKNQTCQIVDAQLPLTGWICWTLHTIAVIPDSSWIASPVFFWMFD